MATFHEMLPKKLERPHFAKCWAAMNEHLMSVAIGLVLASPQVATAQSGFYVQINTNASVQDIIGDAANEPSIAVDPNNPNRMAVGWRQFDAISSNFRQAGVAYTTNGGMTWTSSVLTPGQMRSDPVLRSDAVGNFYYSSLSSPTSGEIFKSTDGGATWGPPINSFGGDKEWIAIDNTNGPGRGNVYEDWNVQSSSVANRSFTRSTNGGADPEKGFFYGMPRQNRHQIDDLRAECFKTHVGNQSAGNSCVG
jgi:hypothetical protein